MGSSFFLKKNPFIFFIWIVLIVIKWEDHIRIATTRVKCRVLSFTATNSIKLCLLDELHRLSLTKSLTIHLSTRRKSWNLTEVLALFMVLDFTTNLAHGHAQNLVLNGFSMHQVFLLIYKFVSFRNAKKQKKLKLKLKLKPKKNTPRPTEVAPKNCEYRSNWDMIVCPPMPGRYVMFSIGIENKYTRHTWSAGENLIAHWWVISQFHIITQKKPPKYIPSYLQ